MPNLTTKQAITSSFTLSTAAQINAIHALAEMAHDSLQKGARAEAVQLLNKAGFYLSIVLEEIGPVSRIEKATAWVKTTSMELPTTLLDEIAQGQLGRRYSRATEAQQGVIRDLARRAMVVQVSETEGIEEMARR